MGELPRPRILFSSCLTGDRVRYDGRSAETEFTVKLLRFSEPLKVCPEVSLGLGVPRGRIVVHIEDGSPGLFQPSTGRDLTGEILNFSRSFLDGLPEVDGFLLKSKSPSCGVSRTKTFCDREGKRFRSLGRGLFASEVLKRFPLHPVADEVQLSDFRRRLHFLFRVFGLARIREEDIENLHEVISPAVYMVSQRMERLMRKERRREIYRNLFLKVFSKPPPLSLLEELCSLLVPKELLDPPDRLP